MPAENTETRAGQPAPEAYAQRWLGDPDAMRILRLDSDSAAEQLGLVPEASLDLVLWLQRAGRCADVPRMLAEIARLLVPGGRLLVHDLLVPGNRLRGKKARREREAGAYINTWTELKDPTHVHYYHLDAWQDMLAEAGLHVVQWATETRALTFAEWLGDAPRSEAARLRLQAMLLQAPERVQAFLTPQVSPARITFQLTDLFILAGTAQENPSFQQPHI